MSPRGRVSAAFSALCGLVTLSASVVAQNSSDLPNTFPHNYTGIPSGDYSTDWQDCVSFFPVYSAPRNIILNLL